MLLKLEIATNNIFTHFLRKHTSHGIYTPPGSFDTEQGGAIINGKWRNDGPMTSLMLIHNIPRR